MTVADRYRALLERIDSWFGEAVRRRPGVVPCGRGCFACCLGPFDVTTADAALVAAGFHALPRRAREEVVSAARRQMRDVARLEPGWEPPWAIVAIGERRFDRVCGALAAAACPFLDGRGACRIYHDRPLACRMMGLPMRAGRGRVVKNACPIQRQFPAYAALSPQPFPLASWEREEEVLQVEAAQALFGPGGESRADERTFLAASVVRGCAPGNAR